MASKGSKRGSGKRGKTRQGKVEIISEREYDLAILGMITSNNAEIQELSADILAIQARNSRLAGAYTQKQYDKDVDGQRLIFFRDAKGNLHYELEDRIVGFGANNGDGSYQGKK